MGCLIQDSALNSSLFFKNWSLFAVLSFPCDWFYRPSSEVGWTQVRTPFYHLGSGLHHAIMSLTPVCSLSKGLVWGQRICIAQY